PDSTYVRRPPYFDGMPREPGTVEDIHGAHVLVMLGDSVTTDHISPAGAIRPDSPAGKYLIDHSVERKDFNSYGSRRGNHEVMVRGTFANVRLKNQLVPGSEGTWTVHVPSGEEMTIYDASQRYLADGMPTIVLAGKAASCSTCCAGYSPLSSAASFARFGNRAASGSRRANMLRPRPTATVSEATSSAAGANGVPARKRVAASSVSCRHGAARSIIARRRSDRLRLAPTSSVRSVMCPLASSSTSSGPSAATSSGSEPASSTAAR